jgi:hypothetical protein
MPATNKPARASKPAEKPKLIELNAPTAEVARVELFSINGKAYTVPTSMPQNKGLRYVNIARKQGPEASADYLLETLLGEEAYDALMDYDALTEEDMTNILEAVTAIAIASAQNPKV